jgi:NTP pyrophosphatase (non-canonical NTP hydrolase)
MTQKSDQKLREAYGDVVVASPSESIGQPMEFANDPMELMVRISNTVHSIQFGHVWTPEEVKALLVDCFSFLRRAEAAQDATPAPRERGYGSLRAANAARQREWDGDNQITLAYRGNELAGEAGEVCNVIKKLERERIGIRGSRDTTEHLAEELADVVICADLIAMDKGIDLERAVADKFNATSEKVGLQTRLSSQPSPAHEALIARTHGIAEALRTGPQTPIAIETRDLLCDILTALKGARQ